MAGERLPDVVIAPCGGGSNLGGIALPFVEDDGRAAHGRRAVVVPHAHRGPLRLRLRRHRGHDAAAADVHARPRVHAAPHPRRRAALPRRRADHQPAGEDRAHGGRRLPAGQGVRGGQISSPGPRARSPRPRRPTASAPPSTRRWPPRRPARSGSSSSTTPGTASSTSPPTTTSTTAASSTGRRRRNTGRRRAPSALVLAHLVAFADHAGHDDAGVQAPEPERLAGLGVDEAQRLAAEALGELGAAGVGLRGDLDDGRPELAAGCRRAGWPRSGRGRGRAGRRPGRGVRAIPPAGRPFGRSSR